MIRWLKRNRKHGPVAFFCVVGGQIYNFNLNFRFLGKLCMRATDTMYEIIVYTLPSLSAPVIRRMQTPDVIANAWLCSRSIQLSHELVFNVG